MRARLCVGVDQVAISDTQHRALVVDPADVAVSVSYADGGRQLIRNDGYQLTFEPTLWREAERAASMIEKVLAATPVVAKPARGREQIPRPTVTTGDRVRYHASQRGGAIAWIALIFVALAVGGVTYLITKNPTRAALNMAPACLYLLWFISRHEKKRLKRMGIDPAAKHGD